MLRLPIEVSCLQSYLMQWLVLVTELNIVCKFADKAAATAAASKDGYTSALNCALLSFREKAREEVKDLQPVFNIRFFNFAPGFIGRT